MNIKPLAAVLVLPALLLVGCGDPKPKPPSDPLHNTSSESKMEQVKRKVEQDAPSWKGKDLQSYIVAFCKSSETPNLLDLPPTPKGVTEEDAGYVGGILISSGACEE